MTSYRLTGMDKIVIDSSVFISLFGTSDIFSSASEKFLRALPAHVKVIIPAIVMAETVINLSKKNIKSAKKAHTVLSQFTMVPIDESFMKHLMECITKPLSLKSSDAIIAVMTKMCSAVLITWDKELLSSKNTLCKALTPTQFLQT